MHIGLFGGLHVWFVGRVGSVDGFDILEILGDLVDLLLWLGWNWGWNFFNAGWNRLVYCFVVTIGQWDNPRSEFVWNFFSKRNNVLVYYKRVLFRLIYQRDEILNCFSNTLEIFQIIRFGCIDLFVGDVFSHEVKWVLDILRIWSNVFDRAMEWDWIETAVLKIRFHWCI